ncbi:MAG: hypothetical protein WDA16_00320 [Candidatus Thermoplasmatota archaeon]
MRVIALLVLALTLVGCTRPEDVPTQATSTPTISTLPSPAPIVETLPAQPIRKVPLVVLVNVSDRWLRPNDTILASAQAPEGAAVSWYLAPRNPYVAGEDNVDLVPRSLGVVSRGSASIGAMMPSPGWYSYELKDAPAVRFNVTVSSSGSGEVPSEVRLVRDEFGLRFAPSELVVGPSVPVSVRSFVDVTAEVQRADQMVRTSASGQNASIPPPTLVGDYDVVALVRDAADGWGEGSVRIIVDPRKPDANVTFGPYTGTFTAPINATSTTSDSVYRVRFDFEVLHLNWTTSTDGAIPASVRVIILDANGTLVTKAEGARGDLEVRGAPRSGIVRVEAVSGIQVSYKVTGEGRMVLEPPATLFTS